MITSSKKGLMVTIAERERERERAHDALVLCALVLCSAPLSNAQVGNYNQGLGM